MLVGALGSSDVLMGGEKALRREEENQSKAEGGEPVGGQTDLQEEGEEVGVGVGTRSSPVKTKCCSNSPALVSDSRFVKRPCCQRTSASLSSSQWEESAQQQRTAAAHGSSARLRSDASDRRLHHPGGKHPCPNVAFIREINRKETCG